MWRDKLIPHAIFQSFGALLSHKRLFFYYVALVLFTFPFLELVSFLVTNLPIAPSSSIIVLNYRLFVYNILVELIVGLSVLTFAYLSFLLTLALYLDFAHRIENYGKRPMEIIRASLHDAYQHKRLLFSWPFVFLLIVILFHLSQVSGSYVQVVVGVPASLPPALLPFIIDRNKRSMRMSIFGMLLAIFQIVFQLFTPYAVDIAPSDFTGFLVLLAFIGIGYTMLGVYSFIKLERASRIQPVRG